MGRFHLFSSTVIIDYWHSSPHPLVYHLTLDVLKVIIVSETLDGSVQKYLIYFIKYLVKLISSGWIRDLVWNFLLLFSFSLHLNHDLEL